MPIIDEDLKNTVNDHDHRDIIASGVRAFSKSLVNAADMVMTTDSSSKITNSDKLIDKDLKDQINASPNSEEIKKLLNQMTPKLLKTLDTVAKGGEVGTNLASKAVESASVGEQDKQATALTIDIIKTSATNVGAAVDTIYTTAPKPLIKSEVKAAIKAHPHREALKKGLDSFISKFIPVIEKAAAVGSQIGANVALTAIKTTVKGETGEAVAKMTSLTISDAGKGFTSSIEATRTNLSKGLLDPALKQKLEEHPHREAVKEFFKNFIPKLLSIFEVVATIGSAIGGDLAQKAIEAAMPGDQGKMLAEMTEKMIADTGKSLGAGVASITTTKTEVKTSLNSKEVPEAKPMTGATQQHSDNARSVDEGNTQNIELSGADSHTTEATH